MHSWASQKKTAPGFTIVELLIVIVVIGILAAITIVAFNGVQDRAKATRLQASAKQASDKVAVFQVENGYMPATVAAAGVPDGSGVTYSLVSSGNWYCATATIDGQRAGQGSNGRCGMLNVKYYNNADAINSLALTRTEYLSSFNYPFGGLSPAPGVNATQNSGVWEGFLAGPTTGAVNFRVFADDGVEVSLGDTVVLDRWNGPCCQSFNFSYNMTHGQSVPFKIRWNNGGGGSYVHLYWTYSGQAEQLVPGVNFSI